MMMFGLHFDSEARGLATTHNLSLVALSFVIALFASYCAIDIAERMRATEGRSRLFWLGLSGLMLGGGIWSMHFVGMIAFEAPLEAGYRASETLVSAVVILGAVVLSLAMAGRKPDAKRLVAAGGVFGVGMIAMHYIGMAALIFPGEKLYRPSIFVLSSLIALTAAMASLWLMTTVTAVWQRALAALAMAIGVCGMHYTAMAGTVLRAMPYESTQASLVSKPVLAAIVSGSVGLLVIAGLIMAFIDRRMADQATQEARRLREMNRELDRARSEAEAANEAKARFLATMSHELRTPMNGVLGMLEASLRSDLRPDVRDQLATARESAVGLLQILNDILDFSKIEAGKLEIERVAFSPREQIDIVASMLAPMAAANSIGFEVEGEDQAPPGMWGDPTRFRQVLVNLVGNAIKFTREGGVTLKVAFAKQRLLVEVRDTGVGIDGAIIDQLFRRFSQADASTTRRFGGTGLGLAICRELVHAMGGDIFVTSELGKGSVFSFELPVEACEPPAPMAAPSQETMQPVRSLRILVAEDNPVNQKVLRVLLAQSGHSLQFVDNGRCAVEAVKAEAFDLVLMDVHMPVMDGIAATQTIRRREGDNRKLPIIALTANAMAGDREHYLAAGMDDYVSKPIQQNDLFAAIARQARSAGFEMTVASDRNAAGAPDSDARPHAQVDAAGGEANLDDMLDGLIGELDALVARDSSERDAA